MTNRVSAYRARMKERGYKEVRYWIPDVTSTEFVERIHNEAGALNQADRGDETADFLDDVQADTLADS